MYEKYHAIISEHYGNFGNAYYGRNLCGETVFSYPGIGTLAYESARYKDYNLLMIISLMSGIIIIACNMAAQILNERIDPRMRISRQSEMQEVDNYE